MDSKLTTSAGHLVRVLVLLCVFPAMQGCDDDSANRIRIRKACLSSIYHGYDAYLGGHDVGPADVSSFADYLAKLESSADPPVPEMIGEQLVAEEVLARLREGEIVVIWSARYPPDDAPRANYLLAFEARTPGSGGYVVQADGLVKHVTAKEFGQYRELPQ